MTTTVELATAREHVVTVGGRIAEAIFAYVGARRGAFQRWSHRSHIGLGFVLAVWGSARDPSLAPHVTAVLGTLTDKLRHIVLALDELPAVRAVYVAAREGKRSDLDAATRHVFQHLGAPMIAVAIGSQPLQLLLSQLADHFGPVRTTAAEKS